MYVEHDRPKVMATVFEQMANGMSLVKICEAEGMPSRSTVKLWLKEEEYARQYERARMERAEFYADEIIEIADKATDAQLARLQVDARKWYASKLDARMFGDKVQLGGDPESPLQVIINKPGD